MDVPLVTLVLSIVVCCYGPAQGVIKSLSCVYSLVPILARLISSMCCSLLFHFPWTFALDRGRFFFAGVVDRRDLQKSGYSPTGLSIRT